MTKVTVGAFYRFIVFGLMLWGILAVLLRFDERTGGIDTLMERGLYGFAKAKSQIFADFLLKLLLQYKRTRILSIK